MGVASTARKNQIKLKPIKKYISHIESIKMSRLSLHYTLLTVIMVLALGLRLYHLDSLGFWYDEGATLAITLGGLQEWQKDVHPPLYYFLLSHWIEISRSEFWVRLFSVGFGTATIPLVYLIGRKMFGWQSGLVAAGFLAILPFHIRYSQEARMYALMTFLFALALWGLLTAIKENRRLGWLAYVVGMTLLAYSQGIGIVYIVVLGVVFLLLSNKLLSPRTWIPFILASGLVLLGFLPWVGFFAQTTKSIVQDYWITAPTLFNLLDVFRVFTIGEMISPAILIQSRLGVFIPEWLGWLLLLIPFLAAIGISLRLADPDQRRSAWIALSIVIIPTIILFVVSILIKPIFLPRVLLPISVGLVLLFSAAWNTQNIQKNGRNLLIGIMAVLLVITDFYYYRYATKEGWKETAHFLANELDPEDAIYYFVDSSTGSFLLHWYDSTGKIAKASEFSATAMLSDCPQDPAPCLKNSLANIGSGRNVWIVYAHQQFAPNTKQIQYWLDQNLRVKEEWAPRSGVKLVLMQTP